MMAMGRWVPTRGDRIQHPTGAWVVISGVHDNGQSIYVDWPDGSTTFATRAEVEGWVARSRPPTDEYAAQRAKAEAWGCRWVDAEPGSGS